ncbi:hypothetical protein D3C83_210830 [compost metagenome]
METLRDRPAVEWCEGEDLEDEEVEGALREIHAAGSGDGERGFFYPLCFYKRIRFL